MDPEALKEAVLKQVEFYFSKDNLMNDTYLLKLMDANMSAPISAIMGFAKLSALTTDEAVVRSSLTNSTLVTIVDDRIKAVVKTGSRATIILREIPSDVPESEVRAIFEFESCKPIHSVRSDVGDTWFVVMESEEDAKDTLLDLKLKKRQFRGTNVKCRLKSEQSIPRSFYPAPNSQTGSPGKNGSPGAPMHNMMMQGGMGMPNQRFPYNNGMPGPMMGGNMMNGGNYPMSSMGGGNFNNGNGNNGNGNTAAGEAQSSSTDTNNQSSPSKQSSTEHPSSNRHTSNNNGEKGDGRKGGKSTNNTSSERKGSKHADSSSTTTGSAASAPKTGAKNIKIEMNTSNFPPLAEGSIPSHNPACNAAFAGIPVNTPGFKAPFHQYSHDEILSIVRGVQDATLPVNNDKPPQYSQIMDSTPNLDLLHRQRTFSIDETREQLEQGRPVQREAVLGGSIENTVNYSKKSAGGANAGASNGQSKAPKAKSGESSNLNASASSFSYASIVKTESAPVPAATVAPKAKPVPAKTEPKKADNSKSTRKADKEEHSEAQGEKAQSSAPSTPAREKKRREPKAEQQQEAAPAAAPTGWGGKATFANVSSCPLYHIAL